MLAGLPQQVVGGHGAVVGVELGKALKAPPQVARLVVRDAQKVQVKVVRERRGGEGHDRVPRQVDGVQLDVGEVVGDVVADVVKLDVNVVVGLVVAELVSVVVRLEVMLVVTDDVIVVVGLDILQSPKVPPPTSPSKYLLRALFSADAVNSQSTSSLRKPSIVHEVSLITRSGNDAWRIT